MGRTANRRAANMANRRISAAAWFYGQPGFHSNAASVSWMNCSACGRLVTTLVEGECFTCHAPAEGKPLSKMTAKQAEELHPCGILNRQHVDGWDGNWLDCEEALRRNGGRRETFSEMDARIVSDMLHDID